MKKLLALVLFAVMIFALATPVMAINVTAPKVTINLDGVKDDAYAGPFDIKYFNSEEGATGQFWTAWDDNYLYFYFDIVDKTPNHEHANIYERDCIELFIDWTNSRDDDTSEEAHPYWQLRYCSAPNEDGKQFSLNINWAALGWDDHEEEVNVAGNAVVNLNANGYTIEARVPYKQNGINLAEGAVVGFDVMIGDNQEDSGRTSMTFIDPDFTSNNQYANPSELGGQLTLGAAPAAPVVVEEAAPAAAVEEAPVAAPVAPVAVAPTTGDSAIMFIVLAAVLAGTFVMTKRVSRNKA